MLIARGVTETQRSVNKPCVQKVQEKASRKGAKAQSQ